MIAVVALVSLLIGAALTAGLAVTTRSVERRAYGREIARVEYALTIEHGRTADLLTRLAARNLAEYHNVVAPDYEPGVRTNILTDETGLIVVDADDETNVI